MVPKHGFWPDRQSYILDLRHTVHPTMEGWRSVLSRRRDEIIGRICRMHLGAGPEALVGRPTLRSDPLVDSALSQQARPARAFQHFWETLFLTPLAG